MDVGTRMVAVGPHLRIEDHLLALGSKRRLPLKLSLHCLLQEVSSLLWLLLERHRRCRQLAMKVQKITKETFPATMKLPNLRGLTLVELFVNRDALGSLEKGFS